MKKLCLLLAIIILPVSTFAGWFYGSSSAVGVWADDFNRASIGADWEALSYLDSLAISSGRVTGTAGGAGMRWVGASIGADHSAEIQYVSGSGFFELGVRDKVGVEGKAFSDAFNRSNGALTSPWEGDNLSIASNVIKLTDTGEIGAASYVNANIGSDQYAAVTISTTGNTVWAHVRGGADGEYDFGKGYLLNITSGSGARPWELLRLNAGTPTSLGSGTTPTPLSSDIYLVVKGSDPVVLWLMYGNKQIARIEDSSAGRISSGGYPGIGMMPGASGRLDNFFGGDISGVDQRYWVLVDSGYLEIGHSLDKDGTTHLWTIMDDSVSYTPTAGDKIKLDVDNTGTGYMAKFTAYINGTPVADATTDIIPSNLSGLTTFLAIISATTYLDNWRVEEF